MKIQFRVTEDHLKLTKRMNVGWCGDEFGAPEIDPKRPYGNSNVLDDIADILDYDNAELSPEAESRLMLIHQETKTVLQIALATGAFATGLYESEEWRRNWIRIAD